jgi:hypothetical protein
MGLNEQGCYMPMYDIRHHVLAMKIIDLGMPEKLQQTMLDRLVATHDIVLKIHLSDKKLPELEEELADLFDDVTANLSTITGQDIDLNTILEEYSIHWHCRQPYLIDSIDFSVEDHYLKLRQEVMGIMKEGHTPIVILGTDTLDFLAPLLSMELSGRGYLENNTIIFLASMIPFEEDPAHVAHLMQAAMEVQSHRLPGSFALSAKTQDAKNILVHDVLNQFMKVSMEQTDAFRSREVVGMVTEKEGFQLTDMSYGSKIHYLPKNDEGTLATVAPPMLIKQSLDTATAYLQMFNHEHVVFEMANDTASFDKEESDRFFREINARAHRGLATIAVNPDLYCPQKKRMQSMVKQTVWSKTAFVKEMTRAGGVVRSKIKTTDAYIEAMLLMGAYSMHTMERLSKGYGVDVRLKYAPPEKINTPIKENFTIRYTPQDAAFNRLLKKSGAVAKKLTILGLPGGAVPIRHMQPLEALVESGEHIEFGQPLHHVNYNYVAKPSAPQAQNIYAAAQAFLKLVAEKSNFIKKLN